MPTIVGGVRPQAGTRAGRGPIVRGCGLPGDHNRARARAKPSNRLEAPGAPEAVVAARAFMTSSELVWTTGGGGMATEAMHDDEA